MKQLKYPAQQDGVEVGQPVPDNLRCMGTSAKAMREQLQKDAKMTAFMLHQSEINASKALPSM